MNRMTQVLLLTSIIALLRPSDAEFKPNVTIHSCSHSKLVLEVTDATKGGLLYIQGSGPECKRTTANQKTQYTFSFEQCNIHFDTLFRLVVQRKSHVQTGSDVVIPMICIVDTNNLVVHGSIIPIEKEDDLGHNVTVRPTAKMKVTSRDRDVSRGEVMLGDPMSMEIKLDEDYMSDFDIKVEDCIAALIPIVKDECTSDEEIFSNFQKPTQGRLVNDFSAFQPTNTEGAEEVDVSYTCQLAVCRGPCHQTFCGTNNEGRRLKRNADMEVDHISCGTTVRIKSPPRTSTILKDVPSTKSQLCMDTVTAVPTIVIIAIVMVVSWVVIGHLVREIRRADGIPAPNVTRSVGRRLSSVFNMPTAYSLKDPKTFSSIPEEEGETPPQQRRKSISMMRVGQLGQ